MKITVFLATLSFLTCFPGLGSAKDELVMHKDGLVMHKDELVMHKEVMYWSSTNYDDSACNELIIIEAGRDVPDMRDELCSYINGKFSLTLSGPPGTTITFFGKYNFKKENGFLIIKKKDDRKLWLLDLIAFPAGQWFSSEANEDSGAFEAFYNASPIFEESVSSIKWGNNGP
jgi:hypothetical protein